MTKITPKLLLNSLISRLIMTHDESYYMTHIIISNTFAVDFAESGPFSECLVVADFENGD